MSQMARLEFKPGAVPAFANAKAETLVKSTLRAITTQAKRNAPGGPYSTGVLKGSIGWKITHIWRDGVRGEAGSSLIYANSVHGGQPARKITAKRAKNLRFFWRRTGKVETFRSVNHPGTKAQPYLTDALLLVAPRKGFKVTIYQT
jgi:hypothetical protein